MLRDSRLPVLILAALLLAACSAEEPAPAPEPTVAEAPTVTEEPTTTPAPSDAGGATTQPPAPIAVTPAPEGFAPPSACTGEGAYFAEVGTPATPALPERDGQGLTVTATGIEGDDALLEVVVGDGEAQQVEAITLGETVAVEGWTLSVTSVCADTQQVEFDLID